VDECKRRIDPKAEQFECSLMAPKEVIDDHDTVAK
jgi:hypothetical protein